jgi:hypothetical protein
MAATWPASLPQALLYEGAQEKAPNEVVRTQMDAGPPKVRRRFTAGVRGFPGQLSLTKAQVQTLDDFYLVTLQGGALKFSWRHPRTGAAVDLRFVEPPSYSAAADDVWKAALSLELLP